MKKLLGLGLIVVLVASISVFTFAHGGGQVNDVNGDYYRDELNLSTTQVDKVEQIKNKYYERADNIIDDLKEQNYELRELYFAKDNNRDQIIKVREKINQLRDNLFEVRTEMYLDLRQILTADQLARLEDHGFMGFGHMMSGGNDSFDCYGGHINGHMGGHGMRHGKGMMGW